jgi:hypothetical protein
MVENDKFEENLYPEEFDIPVWDGNPVPIKPNHNDTPWGYYDDDALYRSEAIKFSH